MQRRSRSGSARDAAADAYSIDASDQSKSELGVAAWAIQIAGRQISAIGYATPDRPILRWEAATLEGTDDHVAQTRWTVQKGNVVATLAISKEPEPRLLDNSFPDQPALIRALELLERLGCWAISFAYNCACEEAVGAADNAEKDWQRCSQAVLKQDQGPCHDAPVAPLE